MPCETSVDTLAECPEDVQCLIYKYDAVQDKRLESIVKVVIYITNVFLPTGSGVCLEALLGNANH